MKFERLEYRRLLVSDLAIMVDAYPIAEPGDSVTRVIRVFNNGDSDAVDAIVRSEVAAQLEDATWGRHSGFAQVVHSRIETSTAIDPIRIGRSTQTLLGDIDGNGFEDSVQLSDEGTVLLLQEREVTLPFHAQRGIAIGDVNSDGFTDYAFDLNLVFGGPAFFARSEPRVVRVETGIDEGWYGDTHAVKAGDINGDGVDDVLFQLEGPRTETTASGAEVAMAIAGAAFIPGGDYLDAIEDIDARTDGALLSVLTPYNIRPKTSVSDVNADGLLDIVLTPTIDEHTFGVDVGTKQLVVFGSANLRSIDFGNYDSSVFNGTNGFSVAESTAAIPVVNQQVKSGTGNIAERVSIQAGHSIIYEVEGRQKTNANMSMTSSVTGNDIRSSLIHSPVVANEVAAFDFIFENLGRKPAVANVAETISQTLTDATWTLDTTRLFPQEISYSQLGPSLSGLAYEPSCPQCNAPSIYWLQFDEIGKTVRGGLDVDNDGAADDFIVDDRAYFGDASLGRNSHLANEHPALLEHPGLAWTPFDGNVIASAPIGDIDGDGQVDFANQVEDSLGDMHLNVRLSTDLGDKPWWVSTISSIRGDAPTPIPFAGGFDVNADGIDDLLVGNRSLGPCHDDWGCSGGAFLILGRRATHRTGNGSFSEQVRLAPGEELRLRITGVASEHTEAAPSEVLLLASNETLSPAFADLDSDGVVGFSDFLRLSSNFGKQVDSAFDGDLDLNEVVDLTDFLLFAREFGKRLI